MRTVKFTFNSENSGPREICIGGNLDEAATMNVHAYPPYPDFLAPTFTPLQRLTVTNTGPTPIEGLRIMAGRSQTPWSIAEIVQEVTAGYDQERHRIRALFEFLGRRFLFGQDPESLHVESAVSFREQDHPWGFYPGYDYLRSRETYSVLRQLHCYGSGNCVTACLLFNAMCRQAGYKTRIVHLRDHFVSEVFHDGQWRMYDPLCRVIVPRNDLPLGVAELHREPSLVRGLRWHYPANTERTRQDQTFGNRPSKLDDDMDLFSRFTVYENGFPEQEPRLDFILQPGDQVTWWTRFQGEFHTWLTPNQYNWIRPPHRAASGMLTRWLKCAPEKRTSTSIQLPYPIVSGRLICPHSPLRAFASIPGKQEARELRFAETSAGWVAGLETIVIALQSSAIHHLEIVIESGTAQEATLEVGFQVHPQSLPGLILGSNTIGIVTGSSDPELELKVSWEERTAAPPTTPETPQVMLDRTGVVLAACPAVDLPVEYYHFCIKAVDEPFLAPRYGFERITPEHAARFAAKVHLDDHCVYQAFVRLKSENGLWGGWSAPLAFTPKDLE
jgi:hypothetical protein